MGEGGPLISTFQCLLFQGKIFRTPSLPNKTSDERKAIYNAMITTMARLHNVDWRNLGLSDFGRQTDYLRRQVHDH